MGFGSRKPNSNDPPKDLSDNPWMSKDDCLDRVTVLLNGLGSRCSICKRVIMNRHLTCKDGIYYCPDHKPK